MLNEPIHGALGVRVARWVKQLWWLTPLCFTSVAIFVWLLKLGEDNSRLEVPLTFASIVVASLIGSVGLYVQARREPGDNLGRKPGRKAPRPPSKSVMAASGIVTALACVVSVWAFLHEPDLVATELLSISDGVDLVDGEQATIHVPGTPPERDQVTLTPAITNHNPVGDCAGAATLDLTVVVNGKPGARFVDLHPDEELDVDLEDALTAQLLVTVHMPDPTCRVDLTVAHATLHN